MQSLRDKLLRAGLVSEEEAQRSEAERNRTPTATDGVARGPPERARAEVRIPKLPPLAGTKEAHRQASRKQLEVDRQLRSRVLAAQIPLEPGDTTFYFVTRKNKLRRLVLSVDQAKALESGQLAVVERPDPDKIEHALVPAAVARDMRALSERAVRFLNADGERVGFLTDEEIHARASEADESDDSEPSSPSPPPDDSTSATSATTAEPEKWITVRRPK